VDIDGSRDSGPEGEFRSMFEQTSRRVYGYVRRQADAATADEVVAEVYSAAWRRHADLPADALPWLLVTARNSLRNHWRSRGRQQRLRADLAGVAHLADQQPAVDGEVIDRQSIIAALQHLRPVEREALLLVGWDGLDRSAAADVAGCTPATFTVRLHRARRHLLELWNSAGDATAAPPFRVIPSTEGERS
jgi:RNA polymerase sigma-70 factor (ECF subfamily)